MWKNFAFYLPHKMSPVLQDSFNPEAVGQWWNLII
jgi:hypothetical protein